MKIAKQLPKLAMEVALIGGFCLLAGCYWESDGSGSSGTNSAVITPPDTGGGDGGPTDPGEGDEGPEDPEDGDGGEPSEDDAVLKGEVFGGLDPIALSTVVAYVAASSPEEQVRELGFGKTDANGVFEMTFAEPPEPGEIVYAVSRGGDATGSGMNDTIGLLTVAGPWCDTGSDGACTFADSVNINEFTTVASTGELQDFISFDECSKITDNTRSGTCLLLTADANGLTAAGGLRGTMDATTGEPSDSLASAPAGSVQHAALLRMNSLANALASCVNTTGTVADPAPTCEELFQITFSRHADTLEAAWHVAALPQVNANGAALFALSELNSIFSPAASSIPDDWTVSGKRYLITQGGSTVSTSHHVETQALAVYAFGPQIDGSLDTIAGNSCDVYSGEDDPGNCVSAGAEPSSAAMDPYGRYFYVANEEGDDVSMYAVGADGKLTEIAGNACNVETGAVDPGNCIAAGDTPAAVTFDPSGKHVYVANKGGDDIALYSVGIDGALSPIAAGACNVAAGAANSGNCVAAMNRPSEFTVSPEGFLYAFSTSQIGVYGLGADGELTPISGSNCNSGDASDPGNCTNVSVAHGIAMDSQGRYLYVGGNRSAGDSEIEVFAVGADGRLSPITGSPFGPYRDINALSVSPDGRYLYAAGVSTKGNIFKIDAGNGGLTHHGNLPADNGSAQSMTIDPSGRFLFIADQNQGSGISSFAFVGAEHEAQNIVTESSCGYGASGDCTIAGKQPVSVVMDPSGQYVYAVNQAGGDISMYTLASNDALFHPAEIAGMECDGPGVASTKLNNCFAATTGGPLVMDPLHRYAYSQVGNKIAAIEFAADGTPTPVAGDACNPPSAIQKEFNNCFTLPASFAGEAAEVVATEEYVYAHMDRSDNGYREIAAYAIGAGGALAPIAGNSCVEASHFNSPPADDDGSMHCFGSANGNGGQSMVADSTGSFLYISGSVDRVSYINEPYNNSVIRAWSIGTDGSLAAITGESCVSDEVQDQPSFDYLVDDQNCFSTAGGPDKMVVTSQNRLYLTSYMMGDVRAVAAHAIGENGGLAEITGSACEYSIAGYESSPNFDVANNCFASGEDPRFIVADPSGSHLYVSSVSGNRIDAYDISQGAPVPLSNSPFAVQADYKLSNVTGLFMGPDGGHLFVLPQGGPYTQEDFVVHHVGEDGVLTELLDPGMGLKVGGERTPLGYRASSIITLP